LLESAAWALWCMVTHRFFTGRKRGRGGPHHGLMRRWSSVEEVSDEEELAAVEEFSGVVSGGMEEPISTRE
jgi:hypothetical protein